MIHILLADDDKDDRFFFELALKEIPLPTRLSTATDGEKLMILLKENVDNLPDVLFLDLNMPRMNGHECLAEIKKDPRLKKLPVIIYSTSLHEEVADVLYQKGAHYYLKKCDFVELPKALEKVLTLLQAHAERPSRDLFIINPVPV